MSDEATYIKIIYDDIYRLQKDNKFKIILDIFRVTGVPNIVLTFEVNRTRRYRETAVDRQTYIKTDPIAISSSTTT